MVRYILKRGIMMIATLFLVVLLTFVLMHSIPGGPFTRDRKLPEQVEMALNKKYHLDDPLPKQFFDYVGGILRFDLGPSFKYQGKMVNDFIINGFPVSARLGGVCILFILITAIPLGSYVNTFFIFNSL